jgi:hypothetical protein
MKSNQNNQYEPSWQHEADDRQTKKNSAEKIT